MPDDTFIAINSDALHAKSKVYISRALSRKAVNDFDEYQLWASLALELLGKGALSAKHPSLIADPQHWQSLFVAAGINVTTDVKTITAKTLFERLTHVIPRFDKSVQKFSLEIAERRNAELHSADIPFRAMRLDAWEAHYWYACETILLHIGSSLEQWLGAADAQAPRQLLVEAELALIAAVKLRIEATKKLFGELHKADRENRAVDADIRPASLQGALFKGKYDEIWECKCPACGCRAFMAGQQTGEDISEEHDEEEMWEVVEREFIGEEFVCPSCTLALTRHEEIVVAGLAYVHEDRYNREMQYEPDYGND